MENGDTASASADLEQGPGQAESIRLMVNPDSEGARAVCQGDKGSIGGMLVVMAWNNVEDMHLVKLVVTVGARPTRRSICALRSVAARTIDIETAKWACAKEESEGRPGFCEGARDAEALQGQWHSRNAGHLKNIIWTEPVGLSNDFIRLSLGWCRCCASWRFSTFASTTCCAGLPGIET